MNWRRRAKARGQMSDVRADALEQVKSSIG